ncbi:MAG: hypothetical protein OXL37_10450 [Chloroflexota bacterium]|nr:hypothetical protein [Chloroflexota bacterium]MDE2960569.1 hypothetical protein [Chloroflexota bacterium]
MASLPLLTRILLSAALGVMAIACYADPPVPTADVPEKPPSSPGYYRAAGLPHLFGSCEHPAGLAIGVIRIEYTHSIIPGPDWRGGIAAQYSNSGHPTGRHGEPMKIQGDYDAMRVYSFDYYAKGRPGDIVVLGKPGSSSEDSCMVGVLTEEGLPRLDSSTSETADTQTPAASSTSTPTK